MTRTSDDRLVCNLFAIWELGSSSRQDYKMKPLKSSQEPVVKFPKSHFLKVQKECQIETFLELHLAETLTKLVFYINIFNLVSNADIVPEQAKPFRKLDTIVFRCLLIKDGTTDGPLTLESLSFNRLVPLTLSIKGPPHSIALFISSNRVSVFDT
ncbi:hypothetical protein RF11_14180 [Thelohanellus kitauei]|uniref:Uncharacterized protein n=1 Tax=Thelohanellus kitauei TaxID=669202 RepID=A0A0C2N7H6_THEKT|nr:hypothetical protein RF11_14180 [Thelohanellus kitauei]